MTTIIKLEAEVERLKAESKANYRLLKSAVAKRGIDRKERDNKRLMQRIDVLEDERVLLLDRVSELTMDLNLLHDEVQHG